MAIYPISDDAPGIFNFSEIRLVNLIIILPLYGFYIHFVNPSRVPIFRRHPT
jgi:hypothetical protein